MNDQENIRRIAKREAGPLKINVPLTEGVLSNLMKGKVYEWEMTPHNRDKDIRIVLRIYGFNSKATPQKGVLEKGSRDGVHKWEVRG